MPGIAVSCEGVLAGTVSCASSPDRSRRFQSFLSCGESPHGKAERSSSLRLLRDDGEMDQKSMVVVVVGGGIVGPGDLRLETTDAEMCRGLESWTRVGQCGKRVSERASIS